MQHDLMPLLAGAALTAAVALRAVRGGFGLLRERERKRRLADADAESFRIEAHAAAAAARAKLSTGLAWRGQRSLRVAGLVEEAQGVKSFYLTSPDGQSLPAYLPGQHLTVAAPVNGNARPLVRCYTLSDRPRDDYYRLTIKRQRIESESPHGVSVSNWLHDHVRVGDEIQCEAPKGIFFHDPASPRPLVLLGAGVGVTPIMSMLAELDHTRSQKPVYALLGFGNGQECPFREPLESIGTRNHNFTVRFAYSRPQKGEQIGVHYHRHGHVSMEWVRDLLPSNNFEFYVCGPPRMMQSVVPELLEWGVPDDAIHFEAFGPSSLELTRNEDATQRAIGSDVRFSPSGDPIRWDGEHKSLLELAEARGVPIASGCRAGNCGACRVRVVEGATTPIKRPGMPIDEGECLACISLPDGSVTLEA